MATAINEIEAAREKFDLVFENNDFTTNWENSGLLSDIKYIELCWEGDTLFTVYSADYLGEKIKIAVYS